MKSDELKTRTKAFAPGVIRLAEGLPKSPAGSAICYRAAKRAKSNADFYWEADGILAMGVASIKTAKRRK